MKKLKFWNHRLMLRCVCGHVEQRHVSICAHSQKDAITLLKEHDLDTSLYEFRGYWNDCWGNSMDGIKPERGIWVEWGQKEPPKRLEIK